MFFTNGTSKLDGSSIARSTATFQKLAKPQGQHALVASVVCLLYQHEEVQRPIRGASLAPFPFKGFFS